MDICSHYLIKIFFLEVVLWQVLAWQISVPGTPRRWPLVAPGAWGTGVAPWPMAWIPPGFGFKIGALHQAGLDLH